MFSESDCREKTSEYTWCFTNLNTRQTYCVFQVLTERTHTRFGREVVSCEVFETYFMLLCLFFICIFNDAVTATSFFNYIGILKGNYV